jgi:hypothetical protein
VAQSLTYAKRYTLCNALGIVVGGEDDDAQEPVATPQEPIRQPQAKQSAHTEATGNDQEGQALVIIADVVVKSGKTGNKSWTKYGIKTDAGIIYGTFDKEIGGVAQQLKGQGAALEWKRDGQYLTCTDIEPTEQSSVVIEPEGSDLAQGWEPGMDG